MNESLHEENTQVEEGLNLLEIVRLLLRKIKLLFIVVCIGGMLGGIFGVWRTIDMKYYGTTVEFYVNPEKPASVGSSSNNAANAVGSQYGVYGAYGRHVMDAIIKLLGSESFTEQLMLEENGLPNMELYPKLDQEKYDNAVEANTAAEKAWAEAAVFDPDRTAAWDALEKAWDNAGQSNAFSEAAYKKLINNAQGDNVPEYIKELMEAYDAFTSIDQKRNDAIKKATNIQKSTDATIELLLEEWRETPMYSKNLERYREAITYSYLEDDADLDDANNLARSFIYVNINVLNDEEFAKDVLARVKSAVPDYIEQNMIVPTDYEGTSCTRITRTDNIHRTNPNYRTKQTIKYAILAAILTGAVASILIIFLDMQDKRLRDYEMLSKKLQVPVLGIIPTIEEMNQAVENKLNEQRREK